jgi:hypothetical protein
MQEPVAKATREATDEFSLNAAQMEFMLRIHNAAEAADTSEDYDFFDAIVSSQEWKNLFGEMSWDQVWDRYEIMVGDCQDC